MVAIVGDEVVSQVSVCFGCLLCCGANELFSSPGSVLIDIHNATLSLTADCTKAAGMGHANAMNNVGEVGTTASLVLHSYVRLTDDASRDRSSEERG
jgi:hypothetical protein